MRELTFQEGAEQGERLKEPGNSLVDKTIGVSKALARSQVKWTPEERKLFAMVLSKIRWAEDGNSNTVALDKNEIIEALALKVDGTDRSRYLRLAFQRLAKDSEVHWTDPEDAEVWNDDFLILGRRSTRGEIRVTINPVFMPHLENLVRNMPFLTVWTSDIFKFKSKHAFALFERLRLDYDSRYITNIRRYTTKELKSIFGLTKEDYTRKDGSFDRTNFEKKVLNVAIAEINQHSKMMSILPNGKARNGLSFYDKGKKNGFVAFYEFRYFCKTRVVDAEPEENDFGQRYK